MVSDIAPEDDEGGAHVRRSMYTREERVSKRQTADFYRSAYQLLERFEGILKVKRKSKSRKNKPKSSK